MSLLLMVLALLGAMAVLGLGAWTMGRLQQGREAVGSDTPAPAVEEGPSIGGYSPAPEVEPGTSRPHRLEIPAGTLARVRELLALGRGAEAERVLCEEAGMDPDRARAVVERIRGT
ncbi:MAG: hypothetical protein M0026_03980 [Nocardiopsaceae bacterium]|nr:hypothetical protein [Nocardiopsaceae bacterium]